MSHVAVTYETHALFATLVLCGLGSLAPRFGVAQTPDAVVPITAEACVSITPPPTIERIVVFGDSNVDNGNLFRLTGNVAPPPPNWRGRNSNGPNVAEYVAEDLRTRLETYAVSGATTGDSNITVYVTSASTGVNWQIGEFIKSGAAKLGPQDLVILWAGSNDIFRISRADAANLQSRIAQAASNLESAVDRLYGLGARHFVVATRTPREVLDSENDLNGVDLNRAIVGTMNRVATRSDVKITVFDAYASVRDMMTNPSRYGFTTVSALCLTKPDCASERFEDGLKTANGYVNWDSAHKTTRVHRLMADQLVRTLRQGKCHVKAP